MGTHEVIKLSGEAYGAQDIRQSIRGKVIGQFCPRRDFVVAVFVERLSISSPIFVPNSGSLYALRRESPPGSHRSR